MDIQSFYTDFVTLRTTFHDNFPDNVKENEKQVDEFMVKYLTIILLAHDMSKRDIQYVNNIIDKFNMCEDTFNKLIEKQIIRKK